MRIGPNCSFCQIEAPHDLDLEIPTIIVWVEPRYYTFLNLARVCNLLRTFFSAYITSSGFFASTIQKWSKVKALSFYKLSPFLLLNTFLIWSTTILTSLLSKSISCIYYLLLSGLHIADHFIFWVHEQFFIILLITTCINKGCYVCGFLLIDHVKLL